MAGRLARVLAGASGGDTSSVEDGLTRWWRVISARVFRAGEELTDVAVEDLSGLRSQPDTLVWVDVTGGSDEEIDQVGEEFSIHPLALEDCRHQHQRPKVDQYQQHLLLWLRIPRSGYNGPAPYDNQEYLE